MIKCTEFKMLSQSERLNFIKDMGTLIQKRIKNDVEITLFYCGTFYAEIWKQAEHNAVIKINAFKSRQKLKEYLNYNVLREMLS